MHFLKKEVEDGHINVEILGQNYAIELNEKTSVSENAKVIVEDEKGIQLTDAPKINTYEGKVVGKENSSVKFTVDDAIIIGKIVIDEKTYYIEETNKLYNGKYLHLIYDKDAIKKQSLTDSLDLATCGVCDAQHALDFPTIDEKLLSDTMSVRSRVTVDLQTGYDSEFQNIYPRPETRIDRIIDDVNDIFEPAGVTFYINGFKYLSNTPSGNISDILDYSEDKLDSERDRTRSDLVVMFTGKECSGGWIGLSQVYTGNSDAAYCAVQMVPGSATSSYQANPDDRASVTAHELGHSFGATHAEAYKWKTSTNKYYYTVMWSPFMGTMGNDPNYMQPEFSYDGSGGHGNNSCNNIGDHIMLTKGTISGFRIG